jgi:hypothetical protein
MGSITRSFANNLTTSGVLLPASLNNNSIANVTAYNASVATGNMVLLSSQTASASASIEFTTGIDSTYKEYQFYFINIHPATNNSNLTMNFSTDSGSNYNVSKITTFVQAYHNEAGDDSALAYSTANDMVGTGFAIIGAGIGNDNDQTIAGSMQLFNPSSTTYVKHFIISNNNYSHSDYTNNYLIAGYGNTTSAIDAVQFKMSSGNIDDGTILMFGIV